MSQSVTAFLGEVAKRNANEPEFMQAVREEKLQKLLFRLSRKTLNTKAKCYWKEWWSLKE